MMKEQKSLVEGYKRKKNGSVCLSGRWNAVDEVAETWLTEFCDIYGKDGEADIIFSSVTEKAVKLVQENFALSYEKNAEAYIIDIGETITIWADTKRAQQYAVCFLLSQYNGSFAKGIYYNFPRVGHRSVRIYLPPKKDLPFFKKFIDMLVYFGYNAILLEIGGAMEYKRHPEINETWRVYCKSMMEEDDKPYRANKTYYRVKNSVHTFNAGGDIYSQDEMRELLSYCEKRYIEVIPEVPSLSHSEYILISHPELRECDDEPYASTACPSNPDLNKLVADLYDEVIEVFRPSVLHIGHDEWWSMCVCDKCRERSATELYVENVLWSYNYLKERGIQTMMWADKLVRAVEKTGEVQGAGEKHLYNVKTEETIEVMGKKYPLFHHYWFHAPEEAKKNGFHQIIHDMGDCADMLPDDIWYLNWTWECVPYILDDFIRRKRKVIYGNCTCSEMPNSKQRFAAGVEGFSVSDWLCTTEEGLQRWNTMYDLGYGAALCWGHTREEWMHEQNTEDVFREMYCFRNHETLQKSHIEVKHTIVKPWEQGEQYYEKIPYANKEKMTLGNYVINYADGRTEKVPVWYALNIGRKDAIKERWESPRGWRYVVDKHLTTTASVCDIEKREDGIWYKTVFPTNGKVVSCVYVPNAGLEEYVEVDKIMIVNKMC